MAYRRAFGPRLPAQRTGVWGQFIITCGAACRPESSQRSQIVAMARVGAAAPGQTRGAYSIEWNGQSRSSHARTVW